MIIIFFIKKKKIIRSKITSVENIVNLFLKNIKNKNCISNLDIGIKEHFLSNNILKKILKVKLKDFKTKD